MATIRSRMPHQEKAKNSKDAMKSEI